MPTQPTAQRCLNCGLPLAGLYCSGCGQKNERQVHSIWHFVREATEGLTHADSRLWRTLWHLLARPGLVTQEFFAGRRARYLPPVRLYIVVSLLFFLLAGMFAESGSPIAFDAVEQDAAATPGETPAERAARLCQQISYQGPWAASIRPRLVAGCTKTVIDRGDSLRDEFLKNVPRALFILLPLLALAMKLLYLRPRRYFIEHLLFFIHNHSVVFLLFALLLIVGATPGLRALENPLELALVVYLGWYPYRAMRRFYGESRVRTLGKYAALGIVYSTLMLAALVVTAFVSVATV